MALVAFVRGANVGGHRRLRPSIVAAELGRFDVVNVGGTGVFVARKPGSREEFRNELLRRLPFDAHVAICDGRDVVALERVVCFGDDATARGVVRFVSVLTGPVRGRLPKIPFAIPSDDEWYVRVLGQERMFFFGVYRRRMKTIGYLGQLDKALGVPVTTRNWNTIAAAAKILKS